MEFDEYDYLEKTVEEQKSNHETKSRSDDAANGHKREERDRSERSRDRDRERERSRERNREREKSDDRDLEREKSRDRHLEREKSRDRDRDRDREREKSRDRDRDRDRERRSRDRDRDYRESSRSRRDRDERERSRRSRSRSRHEREREMSRERERERERRERELEREIREKERESSRRYKDKKEPLEPEADPERDQRTVFAYQMPLKATERDVYEFFSKAGKVRDVRLIMDRNSRRSKGVGYIEFYDVMSVPMAIALSGEHLLGQEVKVKPSEAEKNLVQSTIGASGVIGAAAARKIYVGNLHFNINEDQLRQLFEPFGPVELVQLPLDLETGQCKGYGFVQFAQVEHAKAAQSLNGKLEIAGRAIKVSAVTDHVTVPEPGANAADLDDDEGGLSLNAQSRAMLMQKLDRTGTASNIAESLGVPVVNGVTQPIQQSLPLPINGQPMMIPAAPTLLNPALATVPAAVTIGEPSECLLLKNMFDPKTETDPEFDLEIRDDVQEECSKFGPVKHIFVDKYSNGNVFLRFDNVMAASSCQRAMHLRWFAGRAISATFMKPSEYEAKFSSGA